MSAWQPIETAPRDGTWFVGHSKAHGTHVMRISPAMSHYKRLECLTINSFKPIAPQFWQPLPEPPQ